ncbi:MAG: YCF48-related protein [Candidatus Dadabacteria bacterium]
MKVFCTIICSFLLLVTKGQDRLPKVQLLVSGTNSSLRGLSAVNDQVIWVSGSNGTVGKSNNGGKDWKWIRVKGFDSTDFRDIEAIDATTAIIMGVGEPAYILKTSDAGESWKLVFENRTKGMFLDAMEFWNELSGIVVGDPVDGKFFLARTTNGGNSWREIPVNYRPAADSGEACFAASGSNIKALNRDEAVFVTGGLHSRAFIRNEKIDLPVIQGKESTGANSIAVYDNRTARGGDQMIVVGGDFANDTSTLMNCAFTYNHGNTWKVPKIPPHGYRSCVIYLSKKQLVCCGTSGVDYSSDGGNTWSEISRESFHVCFKAREGSSVFLAGKNGRIAKLDFSR